jgi:hypothetical protein
MASRASGAKDEPSRASTRCAPFGGKVMRGGDLRLATVVAMSADGMNVSGRPQRGVRVRPRLAESQLGKLAPAAGDQRCGTGAELPCCDHKIRVAAYHRCVPPKPPPCIYRNNQQLRHPENRRKYLSYRILRGRPDEQRRPVSGCRVKSPQSYVPRLGS